MATPLLIAFDLDDTLAPSKGPLPGQIARQMVDLARRVEVAVISGGQFAQFQKQVIEQLPGEAGEVAEHFHLMPTCGTQYYRLTPHFEASPVYVENLSSSDRDQALQVTREEAQRLGYWEEKTWGDILEDRGSQITFSALGQHAPHEPKVAWDPTGEKKNALRAAVAARLPHLEVRSGGSTSVDITRQGIDKAYGMTQLAERTGIGLDDMFFIGDRLDPEGNDYPVRALGVACREVANWQGTAELLDELIPTLPLR